MAAATEGLILVRSDRRRADRRPLPLAMQETEQMKSYFEDLRDIVQPKRVHLVVQQHTLDSLARVVKTVWRKEREAYEANPQDDALLVDLCTVQSWLKSVYAEEVLP